MNYEGYVTLSQEEYDFLCKCESLLETLMSRIENEHMQALKNENERLRLETMSLAAEVEKLRSNRSEDG